jgi:hypothetical protein
MAAIPDVQLGESTFSRSPVDALNTPLSAEDVRHLAETCIVVFKAATAGTVFVRTLLDSLRSRSGAVVTIRDPSTNKVRIRATAATTETEMSSALKSV